MQKSQSKPIRKDKALGIAGTTLLVAALYATWLFLVAPDMAWAKNVTFSNIIAQLQYVITVFFLPLGVMIAASKILYVALFGGLIGIDPLNLISDTNQDGQINTSEVWQTIKASFSGFVHGLCWVGGIFIIFQIALILAGTLAGQLETNFG